MVVKSPRKVEEDKKRHSDAPHFRRNKTVAVNGLILYIDARSDIKHERNSSVRRHVAALLTLIDFWKLLSQPLQTRRLSTMRKRSTTATSLMDC